MMNRFLLLAVFLILTPRAAQAGFSVKDVSKADPAPVSRKNARPSLEIINDRYVPEDLKKKYKTGDDYFNMTQEAAKPPIVVEPMPVPKRKRLEIIAGAPPAMKPAAPPAPVAAAKPAVPVPATRMDTWRARKGEALKDVLKRWSEREGTDFVWTAAESPNVSREFSYIGPFEKAVAGLMQQDSGSLKMKFSDDVNVPAAEPVSLGDNRQAPVPAISAGKSWFASSGASLQAVLRAWAETEGASLIWQSQEDFAVAGPVNEKGGFEDAVGRLLSAYDKKPVRPVGQLYKNPVSGEKVLVIKTDTAG